MGTRAIISIDSKLMIATHWDGYPDSLGKDLLECDKTLQGIITVAKKHSIDFADDSIREEINEERVKELVEKHGLTEKEIRDGIRSSNVISNDDYEIGSIEQYGDWAEYQYNIVGDKVLFRPLRGSYPSSLRSARDFQILTTEKLAEEGDE